MATLTALNYKHPLKPQLYSSNMRDNALHVSNLLSQRYSQLLLSEKYHDCVFLFEDEEDDIKSQSIKCHKLILSLASPVFEAMFYGPLQEKESNILIHDISCKVFQLLMRYIYTGQVDYEQMSLEQNIELYYASEKYLMNELSVDSLKALQRKLRFGNILPTLELSVRYDLSSLREMCLSFFMKMCLGDKQYVNYLKQHYYHAQRDCIKAILERALEMESKQINKLILLEFVEEWCLREKDEDILLKKNILCKEKSKLSTVRPICNTLERSYYKACRPFVVDYDAQEWRFKLKTNRFISLKGLVLHSRLTPNMALSLVFPSEYYENLSLQIRAPNSYNNSGPNSSEEDESDSESSADNSKVIWQQNYYKHPSKYNCDLSLQWSEDVIMSPDLPYEIIIKWCADAFGAEYPCSLQSTSMDGIQFIEEDFTNQGSIVKGLRFVNLV